MFILNHLKSKSVLESWNRTLKSRAFYEGAGAWKPFLEGARAESR